MTACAMIVGMVPMALALESGSQMEAPLGRAVVGGLLVSTFATLLILPAFFAIVMGSSKHHTPSLHPDDSDSTHFDRSDDQNPEHHANVTRASTPEGGEERASSTPPDTTKQEGNR
jgi:hypothetical protein